MARQKKVKVQIARPFQKAETPVQLTEQQIYNAGDWITPQSNLLGLRNLVKNSNILPQSIRA